MGQKEKELEYCRISSLVLNSRVRTIEEVVNSSAGCRLSKVDKNTMGLCFFLCWSSRVVHLQK